ncbi:hypothetical protein K9N68_34235 (plasmid) [Kovacikia minuta CCNUW1]|uniref:outer membrane protein n=1 Tax=Kovacikia minuta TaxID=2931930 RepID=UPI001CCFE125|nr:hypothetical protein [Kovacikia minuta]UBF30277.1 hypothetical protein K9N68_34235 [Kovacikia minuta CCNUW1]
MAQPAAERAIESRHFELAGSSLPLNSIAQADAPPSQPPEPSAQPAPDDARSETLPDRWQFSVEPYFFVPLNVETKVTVAGRSTSFDLGLGDILDFDRAFDAGLRVEAQKNRWGIIFDGFYVSAKDSGNFGVTFPQGSLQRFGINSTIRASADASVSVRQGTIDLAAFYRIVDTSLNAAAESPDRYPRFVVDPILGLRTNILRQEIEIGNVRVGNFPLPVNQDFTYSKTFVEPLIGARIGLDLSERWAISIRGDVSGFNINADRNLTWNLLIGTQYRLSPSTSLQLGYRFNDFDFADGSGLRRAKVNVHQNGILLGVVFRF